MKIFFVFSLLLCVYTPAADPGYSLIGLPIIRNYTPLEYGYHSQNWGACQDNRGLMYFANSDGVLEYDGVSWRLIRLPLGETSRKVHLGSDGIIYVGGFNDFGFLQLDQFGKAHFQSLKPKIKNNFTDFLDVWSIVDINGKVYFSTYNEIFIWDGKEVKTISSPNRINNLTIYLGKIVVTLDGASPKIFDGKSFLPFLKNDLLDKYGRLHFIYSGSDRTIVVTGKGAVISIKNDIPEVLSPEIPLLSDEVYVYAAALLSDGNIALATIRAGIFILDRNGAVLQNINEGLGLANNVSYSLFEDREKNLWIMMEEGISRINLNSPISIFDKRFQLYGSLSDVRIYQDKVYVSSSFGVFSCTLSNGKSSSNFVRLSEIPEEAWNFFKYKDNLYVSTVVGFFLLNGPSPILLDDVFCFSAVSPSNNSDVVILSTETGIRILRLDRAGKIVLQYYDVEGIVGEVRNVVEIAPNDFFVEVQPKNLIRIKFKNGYYSKPEVISYQKKVANISTSITLKKFNERVIAASSKGLYIFDNAKDEFIEFKGDNALIAKDVYTVPFILNYKPGKILFFNEGNLFSVAIELNSNSSVVNKLGRIREFSVYSLFSDDNSLDKSIWLAASTGLLRFDVSKEVATQRFKTHIRKISMGDSVYFSGVSSNKNLLIFPPGSNSININFSSPCFEDESNIQYQSFMEGIDTSWQTPSKNPFREFSHLPSGLYKFRVRAILPSGEFTEEASFSIKVKSHLYANNYAYLFYAFILFFGVLLIIKFRTSVLMTERDTLEAAVEERTHLIQQVNQELNKSNQGLINNNNKLEQLDKEKNEYLGIVAHDLRNPISGILGFAEIISEDIDSLNREEILRYSENIKISSMSMLDIINKLLDINLMEHGKLEVHPIDFSIPILLEEIVSRNQPHCERKLIEVLQHGFEIDLNIFSDRNFVSQILDNLVSNAIKYSYNNSSVEIRCYEKNDMIVVEVEDHGQGIPAEEVPLLFKKFTKLSSRPTAGESSTGIGLSIAYRLSVLLKGKIECKSELGRGTIFTLELPKKLLS